MMKKRNKRSTHYPRRFHLRLASRRIATIPLYFFVLQGSWTRNEVCCSFCNVSVL